MPVAYVHTKDQFGGFGGSGGSGGAGGNYVAPPTKAYVAPPTKPYVAPPTKAAKPRLTPPTGNNIIRQTYAGYEPDKNGYDYL